MLRKIKNYIFDLDGTIINSSNEVLLCFKKAFKQANYHIDESRLTADLIGPPLKDIIHNIAPNLQDEIRLNEIIKNFRTIYDNDENDISCLYDGIFSKLVALKTDNKKVFLATLKPYKPTLRVLNQFGLNMFDDIYSIDKVKKTLSKAEMIEDILQKYQLKKDETIMVGDSLSDVKSAKKAGITSVAVLWGYEKDKEKLIQAADLVINNVEELS